MEQLVGAVTSQVPGLTADDVTISVNPSTGAIELGHITQFGSKMQFGCSIRWIKHVPHMHKILIKVDTEGWNVSGGNLTKVFKEPLELYLEGSEMGVQEAVHRLLEEEQRDSRRFFSTKWWSSFWPFGRSRSTHTTYQPLLAEDMDWI